MLLSIKTSKYVNAITDSYKNIINEFSGKSDTIAIVPGVYDESEFLKDFRVLIRENFSKHNKVTALLLAVKLAVKIRQLVKIHQVDKIFIYHENDWFNIFLYTSMIGLKVKYYIWMHDPVLHSGEGSITKAVKFVNSKFVYKSSKLEKIFISYRDIKDFVSTYYRIEKTRIVPIKLPEIREMEFEDIRNIESSLSHYRYDVIFFGRIEEYKGVELFIDSIDYLKKKYGLRLKGLIAGTGRIESLISQKINGSENISFINKYLSNRELAELIAESRVVVLPYKDATGSITVQVANYYNKPVVASRVGCFPEYVENGTNGLLINEYSEAGLAEKIYELFSNEALYRNIKKQIGSYFKENFDIKEVVKKLENEIE